MTSELSDSNAWRALVDRGPQRASRGTEAHFRLGQLVRKRTLISIDEVSATIGRLPDTVRGQARRLVDWGILDRAEPPRDDHLRLAASGAWSIAMVFEADRVVALPFDLGCWSPDLGRTTQAAVDCDHDPDGAFDAAASLITALLAKRPLSGSCLGVGLAVGVPIDTTGRCRTALAGLWNDRRPAREISDRLHDLPAGERPHVFVDNTASLGALGVFLRRFVITEDTSDVERDIVYVRVGARVSSGLVLKGKFVRGGHGLAGEIGHLPIGGTARCERCDRFCIEARSCTEAIRRGVRTRLGKLPDPPASWEFSMAETVRAFDSLERVHQRALIAAVDHAGRGIGLGLGQTCGLVDPQAIYLGGPLVRHPDIARHLRRAVETELHRRELPMFGDDDDLRIKVHTVQPREPIPLTEMRGAAGLVVQRVGDAWLWGSIERLGAAR